MEKVSRKVILGTYRVSQKNALSEPRLLPVHYRLRAIRGGPLGVFNFTSHFIVIQIFQILFLPPVSFYSHPNISDRFVGDKINLFNLTFHDITIY